MAYIEITHDDGTKTLITPDDAAQEAIRIQFNPSGNNSVSTLKTIAAAFLTYCNYLESDNPGASREFSVARTNAQTASMWAVLGATKEKVDDKAQV